MNKSIFIATLMVVLLAGNSTQAGECLIVNGSFEDDGYIYDITVREPNGFSDVNVPASQFGGWISNNWVTDGSYSLTLYSYWYVGFEANDIAMVSQEVYLSDVNEIVLDLKLETYPPNQWNPDKRSAVVMVDNVEVWNSDDYTPNPNGEYRDQVVPIDVVDRGLHKLSLGIRVDVNEAVFDADTYYYTHWDLVRFNCHCGGFGFLLEDFSRNCYVDMGDLQILAGVWLDEIAPENDPNGRYNLYRDDEIEPYGFINFFDFTVFADDWDGNVPDLKMLVEQWLNETEPDYEYNLYHGDDVYPRLIINFYDFAVFADRWLASSYEQDN